MSDAITLSVVIPVYNEQDNVLPLLHEVITALSQIDHFEVIFVDDASVDDTVNKLQQQKLNCPQLRVLQHAQQCGQSTAVYHGVRAARGAWIATLDGDGQNDPLGICALLDKQKTTSPKVKCFAGWRAHRHDIWSKRISSLLANAIRSRLLQDNTPDTGCGLKLFEREAFLTLPYFDHMHRFLPALFQRAGWEVVSVPVNHRARQMGVSKYDFWGRLRVGISDIRGVAWLIRRSKITTITEL